MSNSTRTCETCAAYNPPGPNDHDGTCRLNPPVFIPESDDFFFPTTDSHWWCLKWSKRGAKLTTIDGGKGEQ